MEILGQIQTVLLESLDKLYGYQADINRIPLSQTRKEFDGDYTVVVFPFVKALKVNPVELGESLGQYVVDKVDDVSSYNVVKGFLNFSFTDSFWKNCLTSVIGNKDYGQFEPNGKKVVVEFSSPNTNKPLHLGHIRNILLGWSCSEILISAGYEVIKTQIINDRGIAVCKSMLAWQKFGNGDTPESTGIKGDHFVGKYYVRFDQEFNIEYNEWKSTNKGKEIVDALSKEGQSKDDFFKKYKNTYFNDFSVLGNQAKDMLLLWEAQDPKIRQLWMMMNCWVYDGFEDTYDKLGVSFDKLYYESDTYLLGKETVMKGLENGVFYKEEDGSVWIDLEDVGMDKKIVLRSDGTAVYITQDIGTAQIRNKEYGVEKMVYVVGDEQDYHFKVLFEILKKLGEPYTAGLYHLSYGMIDLPTGRMKSREGTVVDADDLVNEVIEEARKAASDHGEISTLTTKEQDVILRDIGLAALKFMIIKVSPKRRMIFDPTESVDMQGQTGPYVQNAYVRIKSVLRRKVDNTSLSFEGYSELNIFENTLLKNIVDYPNVIQDAAKNFDPSAVANYCYNLAKDYHRFYHEVRILTAETQEAMAFRLELSNVVALVLKKGMNLLGIEMPERM